ncbi:MAG: hypothetical protein VXZ96_06875 [Myxococcota bacterium]|nr:hypothetical protein [Myxococcota bacterium]
MDTNPQPPHHLLFVCTANICRSPMAHWLAVDYAKKRHWRVDVRSGGTLGLKSYPPADHAISVMNEIGIDISHHRCSGITEDDIQWSDYILVMTIEHASQLNSKYENADGKILQLGTFGGYTEIKDPYKSWKWRFRSCRRSIEESVISFMDQLPPRPIEMK